MPLSTNTLIRIEDRQEYLGQEVINRYNYLYDQPGLQLDLQEIAENFEQVMVTAIRAVQNVSVTHREIYVKNLNNDPQEFTLPVNEVGQDNSITPTPSFTAIRYTLTRTSTDLRNGRKALCGIGEEETAGNFLTAGATTKYNAILPIFSSNINEGNGFLLPIILRESTVGNPAGALLSFVGSAVLSNIVTTQNSRKQQN